MIIDFAKTLVRDDDEVEIWQDRIDKINNKLCDKYYDSRDNQMLQVGSIGRGTAITKTSDYDVIFKLPREVYNRFDSHENNGQSKLLQEVKEEIRKLYSSTNIRAMFKLLSSLLLMVGLSLSQDLNRRMEALSFQIAMVMEVGKPQNQFPRLKNHAR